MSKYSIRGVFWGASIEDVVSAEKWERVGGVGGPLIIPLEYRGELYKPFCLQNCSLYYQFEEYWNKERGKTELQKLTEIQYQFHPADGMCEKLYQKLYGVIKKLHGNPIEDYPQLKGVKTWIVHDNLTTIQLKTLDGSSNNPELSWVGLEYSYNGEGAYDRKVDYRKQALKELGDLSDEEAALLIRQSDRNKRK